jgi:hypothetical protein
MRFVDIVDNAELKERISLLKKETTPVRPQCESDCGRKKMKPTMSEVSSMGCSGGDVAPGWWFHNFEPVWGPFIQRLCGQRKVTLLEFERAASQVPGLTHIEKTIAISAFRQQQKDRLVPSRHTTAFRSEHSLSVV